MKIKTSELTGAALDWTVAKCEQATMLPKRRGGVFCAYQQGNLILLAFSTDWSQGGQIIERESIGIAPLPDAQWHAVNLHGAYSIGPTPLIAAMRCYCSIKLGDEVEIPEQLA